VCLLGHLGTRSERREGKVISVAALWVDRKEQAGGTEREEDAVPEMRQPAPGCQVNEELQKLWGLLVRVSACQRNQQSQVRFLRHRRGVGNAFILAVRPGMASGTVAGALTMNAGMQLPHAPPVPTRCLSRSRGHLAPLLAKIFNGKGISQAAEHHSTRSFISCDWFG